MMIIFLNIIRFKKGTPFSEMVGLFSEAPDPQKFPDLLTAYREKWYKTNINFHNRTSSAKALSRRLCPKYRRKGSPTEFQIRCVVRLV
jgi:hypothetical protein